MDFKSLLIVDTSQYTADAKYHQNDKLLIISLALNSQAFKRLHELAVDRFYQGTFGEYYFGRNADTPPYSYWFYALLMY